MAVPPAILARGPWRPEDVDVQWHDDEFEPEDADARAADRAIDELRERGSPSHDGLAARLAGFHANPWRLELELQPARWSLRLVEGSATESLSALCVTRDARGRWLAG